MKALIVDDEKSLVDILSIILEDEGFSVEKAYSFKDFQKIKDNYYDIAFIDLRLPDITGTELIPLIKSKNPETEIIMLTAYASPETAVDALKKGASDYISKPFDIKDIKKILNKVKSKIKIQENLKHDTDETLLTGQSKAIKIVKDAIKKVAPYDVNVLIEGETGTGKEVAAKMIHKLSKRANRPFVAVNCAAIPNDLLESELFGYVKGAFTGAEKDKTGLIKEAEGGTLFLDEIGEMPYNVQSKLLRFLETKKYRPVGGTKEYEANVRIVAATNRNLIKEVEKGNFREDLYYRLSTITLTMPSLKERKEDIPLLIAELLKEINKRYGKNITKVSPRFLDYIYSLELKGNIRELKNIIEKAVILSDGEELELPAYNFQQPYLNSVYIDNPTREFTVKSFPEEGIKIKNVLDNIEKAIIEYVYEKTGKNKTKSASILGLTLREFRYRFDKYFKA